MPPTSKKSKSILRKGSPQVSKTVNFKETISTTRTYKPESKEKEKGIHLGEVRDVLQVVRKVLDISEDIASLDAWYNAHACGTSKEQYEEDRAELVRELEDAKKRHHELSHD